MPDVKSLENKIFNADCIEFMKSVPDSFIDCIICDLPYGKTASSWDVMIPFDQLWEQYKRITKKNSNIILFGMEPFSSMLRLSNLKDYKYDMYYKKNNASTPHLAKIRPMRTIETISLFTNGGGKGIYNPQMTTGKPYKWNSKRSGGESSNIKFKKDTPIENSGWRYPIDLLYGFRTERGLHPTQKSTDLLDWLIMSFSNKNDIILDSCMGSGSTCISCMNTNRIFIGIEKNKPIYEIAKDRIERKMSNNKC